MLKYNIRAHHGLCISFFEGKGYSEDFTANMEKMIALLEEDPNVKIIDHIDEICKACPHDCSGVCESSEKVREYDNAVMKLCRIESGAEMSWNEFRRLVYENIIAENKLADVCGDCQWYSICGRKSKLCR